MFISSTPSRPTTRVKVESASGTRPHQLGSMRARLSWGLALPREVQRERRDQEAVRVVRDGVPVLHHVVEDRAVDDDRERDGHQRHHHLPRSALAEAERGARCGSGG
jgi:hypothetical protein